MSLQKDFFNQADRIFINCNIASMKDHAYSIIENAGLAVSDNKISWIGKESELPKDYANKCQEIINCNNAWVLPGFVDCHTHLVWGGSRSKEFEMRLNGATYEEIAKKGGGIFSTVLSTRKASEEELYKNALKRIDFLLKQGVTTIEIKSGYGLDLETELKMLNVISQLGKASSVDIHATFLGAHALPEEYKGRSQDYIDLVTEKMLPEVKNQGIATAVDVFCERIGFSLKETRQVFEKAKKLGFNIKLHAEQLSDSKGAALASEFEALSCDHLEYLDKEGAKKMALHNVVATLLPGAFYFLKEKQMPPVETFRKLKIPMAVSTDLNPGSSPVHSMLLILNMSCLLFGLTPEEALLGATINGAKALGVEKTKGSLEIGKDADLVLWDINTPADLCYLAGYNPVQMVVSSGKIRYTTL